MSCVWVCSTDTCVLLHFIRLCVCVCVCVCTRALYAKQALGMEHECKDCIYRTDFTCAIVLRQRAFLEKPTRPHCPIARGPGNRNRQNTRKKSEILVRHPIRGQRLQLSKKLEGPLMEATLLWGVILAERRVA